MRKLKSANFSVGDKLYFVALVTLAESPILRRRGLHFDFGFDADFFCKFMDCLTFCRAHTEEVNQRQIRHHCNAYFDEEKQHGFRAAKMLKQPIARVLLEQKN